MESPGKSSPVKQASILRYMSPQKSTTQRDAEQNTGTQELRDGSSPQATTPYHHLGDRDAMRQSERLTTDDDDVAGDKRTAEADDVSGGTCAVAKDDDNVVGADWKTNMEMGWDGDDVEDTDLLNLNEAEEEDWDGDDVDNADWLNQNEAEKDEPWLCAKKRKL